MKRTTVALFGLLVLAGCAADTKIPEEPAMYLNMAQPGAVLDSQAAAILARAQSPVIIAGDFNDWQLQGNAALSRRDYLHEAFERHHGRPAKTYPARFPLLRLDRIYLRNATSHDPKILGNKPWTHLSDHLPLAVEVHL